MIRFTELGPRRLSERAKRARWARIFGRLALGSSIREIAAREGLTPRRIHQIVGEARQDRRLCDRLIDVVMMAEDFPALVMRAGVMAEGGDAAALGFLHGLAERLERRAKAARPRE